MVLLILVEKMMEKFLLFLFVKMMMKSVMMKEIFGIIHETVRNAELELYAA